MDMRSILSMLGGFTIYESDVYCPVMFIAFLDNLSESKDLVGQWLSARALKGHCIELGVV